VHQYAGACDGIGRDKAGQLVILDWKTSNQVRNLYAMQVSAYAKALEEMYGEEVKEAYVVQLNKETPEYSVHQVKDLNRSFEAFLAALTLFKGMKESFFKDKEFEFRE